MEQEKSIRIEARTKKDAKMQARRQGYKIVKCEVIKEAGGGKYGLYHLHIRAKKQ